MQIRIDLSGHYIYSYFLCVTYNHIGSISIRDIWWYLEMNSLYPLFDPIPIPINTLLCKIYRLLAEYCAVVVSTQHKLIRPMKPVTPHKREARPPLDHHYLKIICSTRSCWLPGQILHAFPREPTTKISLQISSLVVRQTITDGRRSSTRLSFQEAVASELKSVCHATTSSESNGHLLIKSKQISTGSSVLKYNIDPRSHVLLFPSLILRSRPWLYSKNRNSL